MAPLDKTIGREQEVLPPESIARAVLHATVDGVVTIDEEGSILSCNPAAERIFGYGAEELLGENVKVLMSEPYHSEHDDYLRSYRETGRRKIIGTGREVVGRRKDGTAVPVYLGVSEVEVGGRRLFTGIVRDLTERRRLEQQLLESTEQERRRIGQEFHDGLGQRLTSIAFRAGILEHKLAGKQLEEREEAKRLVALLQEAIDQARSLAHNLFPIRLEERGLRRVLEDFLAQIEEFSGISCELVYDESVEVPEVRVGMHLYRIAQEAVNNAVKHSEAARVRVEVRRKGSRLCLRVEDDGIGFPEALPPEAGMGTSLMRYRARLLGAALSIQRSRPRGTAVTCILQQP